MGFVIILILIAVLLWLKSQNSKPTKMPEGIKTAPAFHWRDPVSAEEHLALFAAMGEVVSAFDRPWVSLLVDWDSGPNKDDTVKFSYFYADDLAAYGNNSPGRYIRSLAKYNNVAECSFSFPVSQGGAPWYLRSGNDVISMIRSFAPHAYAESDTIIRFQPHGLDDLPEEYYSRGMSSDESFERLIVNHYNL